MSQGNVSSGSRGGDQGCESYGNGGSYAFGVGNRHRGRYARGSREATRGGTRGRVSAILRLHYIVHRGHCGT